MSIRPNGTCCCDRCGTDVGNGGVLTAVVVSDLDQHNEGMVVNYHFCRDRVEDGVEIKGCGRKIISPSNIKNFEETREQPATEDAPA